MAVELYPHQEKAVSELSNGKILYGPVGSGKSITAAAYYIRREAPKDVYVITTAKKRDSFDWEDEFISFGVGKARNATMHGVLTVDSWNNMSKYEWVKDAFFIFDEQRLVGAGAWAKAFVKIAKRNNWILLSATPGDTWLDYIPVFLANGFYKDRTTFKREHVVYNNFAKFPKVDRYVGTGKLVRLRNSILVEMPFSSRAERCITRIPVNYDRELLERATKGRWHVFEDRPIKNIAELFGVSRKVVNSDSSRMDAIFELMRHHPKLIIFYNFNYELDILRGIAGSLWGDDMDDEVAVAEWNGHKHEAIPKTDRWVYLVQYVAGSEGWNCIETDAMCFYSLTYSYKNWHQAYGRIDRLNTPFKTLHYYILASTSWIDMAVYKSLRTKKSFNESAYAKKLGFEK